MTTTKQISEARPLAALAEVGTSVWLDSLSRAMIGSGELERLVRELDVAGVTANPAIFEKAFADGTAYDAALNALARQGLDTVAAYEQLAVEDVQAAADVLRPVYDRTDHRDGYASLEVAPGLAHDADATLASVLDLWRRLDRPNVMIKIPGTPAGVEAIRRATAAGVNVNVTLLFSVGAYEDVAEAYLAGLEDRAGRGEPVRDVVSVASFFVSRVDAAVDRLLDERRRGDLAGQAAIANARVAYASFRLLFSGERFAALRDRGARVQRPLWASTGVKDPRYRDVMYVEELAGPDTVNTMPPATLEAFADHGTVRDALTGTEEQALTSLAELRGAGVDLDAVTDRLLVEGIEAFEGAMQRLLATIDRRSDAGRA
jgi:transaldolase